MGKNLANAELYIALAAVFRNLEDVIRLCDTVREKDVDTSHDMFTGFLSKVSKGIKLVLKDRD